MARELERDPVAEAMVRIHTPKLRPELDAARGRSIPSEREHEITRDRGRNR